MTLSRVLLACVLTTLGCASKTRRPWDSRPVTLSDIDSITLVLGAIAQDGGSRELVGVTNTGQMCLIALNQHSFLGNYPLHEIESPGRLCFNERLVGVRSKDERLIMDLLRSADFLPVTDEGIRQLVNMDTIAHTDLETFASDSDGQFLRAIRDHILAYVETEKYIEVAKNGLPLHP
ncbi:hypothetical protein [Novipirellula aureliae]|nr:hypothetical protein [Novipirellula aureliae]